MSTILLEILNTKIKFGTNFPRYYDYLSSYFKKITCDRDSEDADITINFFWDQRPLGKHFEWFEKNGPFTKVGSNTLISDQSLVTIRKIERRWKVLFEFNQQDKKITLNTYIQKRHFKDFFRHGPFAKPQHEWFFMMTYHLLYYPLFWYLERQKSTHTLHASALTYKGKGIVICGLEGVGKTSLALKFLQDQDSTFLADNLIFYDQKRVYPCYELIRMHRGDNEQLWKDKFEPVTDFNFLKGFYRPKFDLSNDGIVPDVVIFPEFNQEFFADAIPTDEAVNRAVVLSHLPSELNEYVEYRNLYNLLNLKVTPWISLQDSLGRLLAKSRSIRVGMPKSDGLDKNFDRLIDAINDV